MQFSEMLTEYLDLREAGEPESDWRSIDQLFQARHARSDRMALLLREMDALITTVQASDTPTATPES